jgi:hypothetical protein
MICITQYNKVVAICYLSGRWWWRDHEVCLQSRVKDLLAPPDGSQYTGVVKFRDHFRAAKRREVERGWKEAGVEDGHSRSI